MNTYGYIYKIRNLIDNKIYIGQTIYDFKHRYHNNIEHYTHNLHIKRAIRKYGIENFEIDGEFDVAYSKIELDKLEDLYVKIYNTTNMKYGYNKRFGGGSRGKHTEETKKKMSDNHVPITGEDHHMYGNGFLVTGSKNPRAKKVICLNTKESFDTADEAAEKNGIGSGNKSGTQITACCKGNKKLKTCGKSPNGEKLIWMYYHKYLECTEKEIKAIIKESKIDRRGKYRAKKVICFTTGKIFDSPTKANGYHNANNRVISRCCTGVANYSGKLLDGTELHWGFLKIKRMEGIVIRRK